MTQTAPDRPVGEDRGRGQPAAVDALYQRIVDDAQAATGARLVHFAWYDPATGVVQAGAWSGPGTAPVRRALSAARRVLPGFDVLRVRFRADVNPFNRRVFLGGEAVAGAFADAVAGTVPPTAAAAAVRVAGLRHTFSCPLLVRGAVAGTLAYHTPAPLRPRQRATCEAFARQAALTLENARLRAEAERARAELEAFLDAAADVVLVFGARGQLLRANRAAREAIGPLLAGAAPTAVALLRAARPRRPDGTAPTAALLGRALRGERVSEELVWRRPDGADRRLHAVVVPVRGDAGRAWAVVVVARDITALHAAIAERERLDGAVKTARLVAHELNNTLALLTGYGELLPAAGPADARRFAEKLLGGALEAAAIVARLQRIVRFEETSSPVGPMLDLEAAQRPSEKG